MKNIGLIINPIAGIGGRVALKGSDGDEIQTLAFQRGAEKESQIKARIALEILKRGKESITIYTAPHDMGEALAKEMHFSTRAVIEKKKDKSSANDTKEAAKAMEERGVDLILFAGGDGTAIDLFEAIGDRIPVIGIPAGVKIHSAVYANNPRHAGMAAMKFLQMKHSHTYVAAEVMDIDEKLFRQGIVNVKLYGYMKIPYFKKMMQHPKAASWHNESDISGIYFEIKDRMEKNKEYYYVFGTGSTIQGIMQRMGLHGSLLGIDVVRDGSILLSDATEGQLLELLKGKNTKLIITAIGGQGHIFGRGNHQLSPKVIRMIGSDNIWITCYADKIYNLENHALYTDTSDKELDKEISGYRKVIIGYQEELICRVEY